MQGLVPEDFKTCALGYTFSTNLQVRAWRGSLWPSPLLSHLVRKSRLLYWQPSSAAAPRKVALRWRGPPLAAPHRPGKRRRRPSSALQHSLQTQCHSENANRFSLTRCFTPRAAKLSTHTTTRGCHSVCSGTLEVCKLLVCLALFPFVCDLKTHKCNNCSC